MDATPKFDTGGKYMGTWWGIYPPVPDPRDYEWTVGYGIPDQSVFQENIKLKRTIDELHKRNHELIQNQSLIEQKARTKQRQYDAKVYAYWKQKAEKAQELCKNLINENQALRSQKESLQKITCGLMNRILDRSRKLIAIKRILNESSESNS